MKDKTYNRDAGVAYAHKWATTFNPDYYNFTDIGGDCTNFVSQCIFAAAQEMNFNQSNGWFYKTANDRTATWTAVIYLYNFLINNRGPGPYATEGSINDIKPGDVVQLMNHGSVFHHSTFVVDVKRKRPSLDDIFVCAHTFETDSRPLSSYPVIRARFLHINGVRGQSS
jgi:hypothetical protein